MLKFGNWRRRSEDARLAKTFVRDPGDALAFMAMVVDVVPLRFWRNFVGALYVRGRYKKVPGDTLARQLRPKWTTLNLPRAPQISHGPPRLPVETPNKRLYVGARQNRIEVEPNPRWPGG